MSRPQWGDSMAAKHQFTEFYHWYRQMAAQALGLGRGLGLEEVPEWKNS